jgi:hypothetical protein
MKFFGGQNKYWGNLEEAVETWLKVGIKHIMVKPTSDLPLITSQGNVRKKDFEKLSELQRKYEVLFHLHPYNLVAKNIFLTPSLPKAQPLFEEILLDFDEMIHQYELLPLLTLHLPRFDHPRYEKQFGRMDEATALKNSSEFFQTLELNHCKLALETMHDPYKNPGHALLGYKAIHFRYLIKDKNFGICIDTGHSKMAKEQLKEVLRLSYPIYSVHLNGNDGSHDQHALPARENVGNFKDVTKCLKACQGPIVLEVRDYRNSLDQVKKCINFWQKTLEVA